MGGLVQLVMDGSGAGPFCLLGLPTDAGGRVCRGADGGASALLLSGTSYVLVLGPSNAKSRR